MPSKLSWLLQGSAVSTFTAVAAFSVWTKHSFFEPMDPETDPSFRTLFFKRYNPDSNPTFYDVCVRRIPLSKLDPELREDAAKGGDKLVTRFVQGAWGGWAYGIQRRLLAWKYMNDTTTKHQLWSKLEMKLNEYPEGVEITDHFKVLSRPDNKTVLLRGGGSPLDQPNGPRESDGLIELSAEIDFDRGYAEFRLKCIFFQGAPKTDKAPFTGETFMPWAHRQYAKFLMEDAVGNCKARWTNVDFNKGLARKGFTTAQIEQTEKEMSAKLGYPKSLR